MGFLKFLKREKKEGLDDLDLPPAPPPLEGFEENTPEFPAFPEFPEEKVSAKEEEMPRFEFPQEENAPDLKEGLPEFPAFPEIEETKMQSTPPAAPIPPIKAPFAMPEPAPLTPEPIPEPEQPPEEETKTPADIHPKAERRLFSPEKRMLRERPSGKTIYVRVDNFKVMLGNINMVRSDLRKSEEALMKLENIKNSKDKSFDKVKASLDDLQKRLIFIDKTLFKGD